MEPTRQQVIVKSPMPDSSRSEVYCGCDSIPTFSKSFPIETSSQTDALHLQSADTACFSAGMDAANFGVLFQQLLYELHLG